MKVLVYPSRLDFGVLLVLFTFLGGQLKFAHIAMSAAAGLVRQLASFIVSRRVYLMAKTGFLYQLILFFYCFFNFFQR